MKSRGHEMSRGQKKSSGQDRSRGKKRLRGQERQAILQDEPRTRRSGRDGLKLRQETREADLASRDVFVSPHTTQSASTDSDCGPSCHNLLHQLGHPKEAERCPAGQVLDIWGYCRYWGSNGNNTHEISSRQNMAETLYITLPNGTFWP